MRQQRSMVWVISGYHLSLLMMSLGYSKGCLHDRLLVKLPFMKQQDSRQRRERQKKHRGSSPEFNVLSEGKQESRQAKGQQKRLQVTRQT